MRRSAVMLLLKIALLSRRETGNPTAVPSGIEVLYAVSVIATIITIVATITFLILTRTTVTKEVRT